MFASGGKRTFSPHKDVAGASCYFDPHQSRLLIDMYSALGRDDEVNDGREIGNDSSVLRRAAQQLGQFE
jgi:hypothetical protein